MTTANTATAGQCECPVLNHKYTGHVIESHNKITSDCLILGTRNPYIKKVYFVECHRILVINLCMHWDEKGWTLLTYGSDPFSSYLLYNNTELTSYISFRTRHSFKTPGWVQFTVRKYQNPLSLNCSSKDTSFNKN